jgi:hypothetical protein
MAGPRINNTGGWLGLAMRSIVCANLVDCLVGRVSKALAGAAELGSIMEPIYATVKQAFVL